jgi:hypothetical protein
VTPCAVYTVHEETRTAGFLVEPQNHGRRVSWFGPQNQQLWFADLAHKITTTVSWFGPQNQVGFGLSVAPQNRREDEDGVRHTSRSSGLLYQEASWARVSQFASKLAEERWRVVHVASSWRSQGDKDDDGRVDAMDCIKLLYPNFVLFFVLGHKGSLVISFSINRTPTAGGEVIIQPSLSYPLLIVAF